MNTTIEKPRKYHVIKNGQPTGEQVTLRPSQLKQYETSMGVKFMRHLPKVWQSIYLQVETIILKALPLKSVLKAESHVEL